MNGIRPELENVVFLTLACIAFAVLGKSQELYYCDNGNVLNIAGETSGTIITRQLGEPHYSDNLHCGWKLDAGLGKRIKLTVKNVDLQWAASYALCSGYDHLSVRNGQTATSEVLLDICDSTNPYQLVSSGQYLYLYFISNDKNFYDHAGITLMFQTYDASSCPPGWTNLSTSNFCYSLMTQPASGTSYTLAQQNCGYIQSNLIKIDSRQLFNKVQAYGKNVAGLKEVWIGLNDLRKEETYQWLDGSGLTLGDKMDTFSGSKEQDCVVHNFDTQKWVVKNCDSEKKSYICEKVRVGPTTVYSVPEASDDDSVAGDVPVGLAVVLAIIGGILFVIFFVICFCCYQKKRKPTRQREYIETRQNSHVEEQTGYQRNSVGSSISLNHVSQTPTAPAINIEGSTTLVWGNEYGPAPPSYDEAMNHHHVIK
ncbi:uncharacterized protein LOC110453411 [Mizuhopecten yessoensis]|uniref:Lymphocyte antigen 75 n=1 Tax=Mizuhopecten yessoensis TaxID=6573 RepID=A0A210QHE6_MIZYE|nr:uncharacterized protein LOC110453411 [Mizuhopecten yessoensis]OWF48164.1 Lymphocyte antigen 75 [Mizuhopecten yessoensis]